MVTIPGRVSESASPTTLPSMMIGARSPGRRHPKRPRRAVCSQRLLDANFEPTGRIRPVGERSFASLSYGHRVVECRHGARPTDRPALTLHLNRARQRVREVRGRTTHGNRAAATPNRRA